MSARSETAAPDGLGRLGILGPAAGILAVGAVLFFAERLWPLRPATEPAGRRQARNLAIAALGAAVVSTLETPIVRPLARAVEARRWGLLNAVPLHPIVRSALGLALLDYTLYLWHVLMHRVPGLWRLHAPHHADLDLDASTALRFHFAELAASVPWRALQVVVLGIGPRTLARWQSLTLGCILFHHANLRLPLPVERVVGLVLATPRMHGIHHSTVREEADSNWSSGLSFWDRLHGTLRTDVPQSAIEIGLPAWRAPRDLSLVRVLALPFSRPRDSWRDPLGRSRARGPGYRLLKEPT